MGFTKPPEQERISSMADAGQAVIGVWLLKDSYESFSDSWVD